MLNGESLTVERDLEAEERIRAEELLLIYNVVACQL